MKQIPLRVSDKDYEFLKKLAEEEETTMTAIIRELIKAFREKMYKEK